MNTCTILNVTGDVTIAWDDTNNKEVEAWVQSKLDQGCNFFIVEKKLGFIPVKTKVTKNTKFGSKGEVKMSDASAKEFFKKDSQPHIVKKKSGNNFQLGDVGAEKLIENGHAQHFPRVDKKAEHKNKVIGMARTAKEVMTNNTMCTRRMSGG